MTTTSSPTRAPAIVPIMAINVVIEPKAYRSKRTGESDSSTSSSSTRTLHASDEQRVSLQGPVQRGRTTPCGKRRRTLSSTQQINIDTVHSSMPLAAISSKRSLYGCASSCRANAMIESERPAMS